MREINCVWMEFVGQNVLDMTDVDRMSILIFAAITSVLPINRLVLNAETAQRAMNYVGTVHARVCTYHRERERDDSSTKITNRHS